MRSRLSPAVYDQLLALREAQTQLSRYTLHQKVASQSNDTVRLAIDEAARVAADHARRLDPLLAGWARGEDEPDAHADGEADANTNREVVESWIAVAEDARDLYEHTADQVSSPRVAAELRRLAGEEARVAENLRALL